MKILISYLKPHKLLVFFVLALAAINTGFSLMDPIILGKSCCGFQTTRSFIRLEALFQLIFME